MEHVEDKARRRIRRFIRTGEHQARVYAIGKRIYEYKVKHYSESIFFKQTIFGRVKKVK